MKVRKIALILLISALLFSCTGQKVRIASEHRESLPEFNQIILNTINEMPADGTHGYWWGGGYDGATEDIYLQGIKVMRGEKEKRSYCCGLTLEVFLKSYKKWLEEHGGERASAIPADKWSKFQGLWFVQKVNGPGPSAALEAFDLGHRIDPDQALPGDLIQIWRTVKEGKKTPSGHSVIFLDWARDEGGNITGIRYWSTQPGTDGISEQTEYFKPDGGINGMYTYFSRVDPRAVKVKMKPAPKAVKKKAEAEKEEKKAAKTEKMEKKKKEAKESAQEKDRKESKEKKADQKKD